MKLQWKGTLCVTKLTMGHFVCFCQPKERFFPFWLVHNSVLPFFLLGSPTSWLFFSIISSFYQQLSWHYWKDVPIYCWLFFSRPFWARQERWAHWEHHRPCVWCSVLLCSEYQREYLSVEFVFIEFSHQLCSHVLVCHIVHFPHNFEGSLRQLSKSFLPRTRATTYLALWFPTSCM